MDLEQLIECVLPMGWITQNAEYPYFSVGTSFLFRSHARLWLATATHVLREGTDNRLSVPWNLDTHDLLPLETAIEPTSRDPEDNAFADVTVFGVKHVPNPPAHTAIDVAPMIVRDWSGARAGDEIIFAGFPRQSLDNEIDFDAMHITRQRFVAHADYVGTTASRWLHSIKVRDMGKVTTLNGMSGSPVFYRGHGSTAWSFGGIIVRGNDAGAAQFIEARVAWWLADSTLRTKRNRAKKDCRER